MVNNNKNCLIFLNCKEWYEKFSNNIHEYTQIHEIYKDTEYAAEIKICWIFCRMGQ